jgi:hypothetical protein
MLGSPELQLPLTRSLPDWVELGHRLATDQDPDLVQRADLRFLGALTEEDPEATRVDLTECEVEARRLVPERLTCSQQYVMFMRMLFVQLVLLEGHS